jgi:hypothetical protein
MRPLLLDGNPISQSWRSCFDDLSLNSKWSLLMFSSFFFFLFCLCFHVRRLLSFEITGHSRRQYAGKSQEHCSVSM